MLRDGFGFTSEANALLERARPATYQSRVSEMYISKEKSTTYKIAFDSWGPDHRATSSDVNAHFYNNLKVGYTR